MYRCLRSFGARLMQYCRTLTRYCQTRVPGCDDETSSIAKLDRGRSAAGPPSCSSSVQKCRFFSNKLPSPSQTNIVRLKQKADKWRRPLKRKDVDVFLNQICFEAKKIGWLFYVPQQYVMRNKTSMNWEIDQKKAQSLHFWKDCTTVWKRKRVIRSSNQRKPHPLPGEHDLARIRKRTILHEFFGVFFCGRLQPTTERYCPL